MGKENQNQCLYTYLVDQQFHLQEHYIITFTIMSYLELQQELSYFSIGNHNQFQKHNYIFGQDHLWQIFLILKFIIFQFAELMNGGFSYCINDPTDLWQNAHDCVSKNHFEKIENGKLTIVKE